MANIEPKVTDEVTEEQIQRWSDVRCWLAYLYKYCFELRPNYNPDQLKDYQLKLPSDVYISSVTMWHIWLTTYMLMFNQMGWKVLKGSQDGIDFGTTPLPKLEDVYLMGLSQHSVFENKPFLEYTERFKLTSKEQKTLRTLAMRLS